MEPVSTRMLMCWRKGGSLVQPHQRHRTGPSISPGFVSAPTSGCRISIEECLVSTDTLHCNQYRTPTKHHDNNSGDLNNRNESCKPYLRYRYYEVLMQPSSSRACSLPDSNNSPDLVTPNNTYFRLVTISRICNRRKYL